MLCVTDQTILQFGPCEYWPKVSSFFFFPWDFIYWRCRNKVSLFSQNNQPTLDWKLKNNWTKSCQDNISHSLAKRKRVEKNNGWKFSNQSSEDMYASTYLTNRKSSFFFFRLPCLEYLFIIANLVRLNLAVLKISNPRRDDQIFYSYHLTALWPHAQFNDIFTHMTITTKISGTNMKVRRVLKYEVQKKNGHIL